jgi:hypothetical protein
VPALARVVGALVLGILIALGVAAALAEPRRPPPVPQMGAALLGVPATERLTKGAEDYKFVCD